MIQVLEEGRWWTPDPSELVEGIMRLHYTSATQSRDSARPGDVQVLPLMLTDDHFRRISNRLLDETHRIYDFRVGALGLARLEELCRDLSGWPCQNLQGEDLQVRANWLTAWLAELSQRTREAEDRYRAFLAQPKGRVQIPANLALITRNNLAVLLLKRGQFSKTKEIPFSPMVELARLAILELLPAACLSLLNVLLVAHKRFDPASQLKVEVPVREILKVRSNIIKGENMARFLGGKDGGQGGGQEEGQGQAEPKRGIAAWAMSLLQGNKGGGQQSDEQAAKARRKKAELALRKFVAEEMAPWIGRFAAAMLYDGRAWQLLGPAEENQCTAALYWLTTHLRAHAAGVSHFDGVLDELKLWSHPRDLLVEAGKLDDLTSRTRCSEAMSLLYAHDVPDVPDEPAGGWDPEKERLEQARRAYQTAYQDLEAGRYEAAEAGFKEARKIASEAELDLAQEGPEDGGTEGGGHG